MKILFAYYIPSGGVETLARQRSAALKPFGVEFDYLYFQFSTGIQNIKDEKVFVTNEESGFKKIIQEGNYDAIVVCSDHPFVEKARNYGYTGKIIYEVQGLGSYYAANHWLRIAKPIIDPHADAILFPQTPHLISLIQKYYPNKKHFCFHNCLDTNLFRYRTHPKHPNPIIGWVGRIEDNKNWSELLEIASKLKKNKPNLEVWLFEDKSLSQPDERAKFESKLNILGLQSKIKFFDNVPHHQMADYYSIIGDSGGLLCSTSKVEGFGYAVLEAMSCNCPILSSDSDGVKSFITHNVTGKLYPLGNIDVAVKEGNEILFDTNLREKLIRNGASHVYTQFSPSTYAKNFLSMLKELVIG